MYILKLLDSLFCSNKLSVKNNMIIIYVVPLLFICFLQLGCVPFTISNLQEKANHVKRNQISIIKIIKKELNNYEDFLNRNIEKFNKNDSTKLFIRIEPNGKAIFSRASKCFIKNAYSTAYIDNFLYQFNFNSIPEYNYSLELSLFLHIKEDKFTIEDSIYCEFIQHNRDIGSVKSGIRRYLDKIDYSTHRRLTQIMFDYHGKKYFLNTRFSLLIAETGKVIDANVIETDYENPQFNKLFTIEIRKWKFPKMLSTYDRAYYEYEFSFQFR